MSFYDIMRIIHRPNEKYFLEKKIQNIKQEKPQVLKDEVGNIIRKDPIGNISDKWQTIIELEGVIQHRQKEKIAEQGEESIVKYTGYFTPNFHIETDKLSNYRVRMERDYETLYLKILQYDPNNFFRGQQHHIVLVMKEDLKYKGRQQ